MQRYQQSTSVILSLVGVQDISVVANRAMTEGATVGVRLGKALFYLHDRATTARFAKAFIDLGAMSGMLPREVDSRHVAPIPGVRDAAVVVDAGNEPRVYGRLEHLDGHRVFLRVGVGRVVMDVWDIGAYASLTRAFRDAAGLAATTFLPGSGVSEQQRAAREAAARAASAFPTPQVRRRIGRVTAVPAERGRAAREPDLGMSR